MKRNLEFTTLTDEEFKEFALKHPQHNFFESLYMKELLLKENREVYLVGVKEDKRIVAGSLLASSYVFMGKKTIEALKGFLIDYDDYELLEFFTTKVKEFVKLKKGFRLTIDPYILNVERDTDAKIIENGKNNKKAITNLKKLGFKPLDSSVQVKWTYVLDIKGKDEKELFASFKQNTRNCISRTINKYKLIIEQLDYQDLDVFKKITSDTCQRRGFKDRTLEYYQNMYKIFKDDLKVLICKLDCRLYLKSLKEEKKELEERLKKLSDSPSNDKKRKNIKEDLEVIKKRIKEVTDLKKEHGQYVILSGAMYVLYGDEIVYLFSGSYDEYMKYYGQYALQWEMIKYAAKHNYRRYNFYGIKDVFNKDSKDYGVYKFKKGFNGYVEELVGAFEIGTSGTYYLYKFLKKIKSIVKK